MRRSANSGAVASDQQRFVMQPRTLDAFANSVHVRLTLVGPHRTHEMRAIVTDDSVAWCVCHAPAPHTKTAERIDVLFGVEAHGVLSKAYCIRRESGFSAKIRCGLCHGTLATCHYHPGIAAVMHIFAGVGLYV